MSALKAYLDIETSYDNEITVIGIFIEGKGVFQLIKPAITADRLLEYLDGVEIIYTFNGLRFDIPLIRQSLGIDLKSLFPIVDLHVECKKKRLGGGLKKLEKIFGIRRTTEGLSGFDAMRLWENYKKFNDLKSLFLLLRYNEEDILNLAKLEYFYQTLS